MVINTDFASPCEGEEADTRWLRYALQRHAARVLGWESRVNACSRVFAKEFASIGGKAVPVGKRSAEVVARPLDDGGIRARYTGLVRCGSIWRCPLCAAAIAAERAKEVTQAVEAAWFQSLTASFVTFTFQHQPGETLEDLLAALRGSLRRFFGGKAAKGFQDRTGWAGLIRALEVTHGASGWHPHVHMLWITARPLTPEDRQWVEARWLAALTKGGRYGAPGVAVDIRPVRNREGIGRYVAKVGNVAGISLELTAGHAKNGTKRGQYTPMQLLQRSYAGDRSARARWAEYAEAMTGQPQLRWSKGLRELLGLGAAVDDLTLAEQPVTDLDRVLGALPDAAWYWLNQKHARAELLNRVERDGWAAALAWAKALAESAKEEGYRRAVDWLRADGRL